MTTKLCRAYWRRTALTVGPAIVLAGFAIAGTGCPDMYTYHLHQGVCYRNWGCLPLGFIVDPGNYTDGGCQDPGKSANQCTVHKTSVNLDEAVGNGGFINDTCGQKIQPACTIKTVTIFGILYGLNDGPPCNYNG